MNRALSRSFASLRVPNYRRFFAGQLVSTSGNWIQMVAEVWLILTLTGSGLAVGVTTALQFVPMLLIGAWGGLIADRVSKRGLLMTTQTLHMVPPLILFALVSSGAVTPLAVYAVVLARGMVNAIDYPARQSFVVEMVGPDRVVNAVSLNGLLIHSSRIIGPAIAGTLIATVGIEPCFLLNAASYAFMALQLSRMDPAAIEAAAVVPHGRGAVRAAIRYVRATPSLWIPLALMAVVGTLGFNFMAILPLLARFTFDGGSTAYAALVISMGVGAVAGALVTGARGSTSPALLAGAALGFGGLALIAAAAPSLLAEMAVLVPLGAVSVTLAATVNSSLQLAATPEMRGRVMALYAMVFLGTTPIGGPLAGWLAEALDPRAALVLAGLAGLTAGAIARTAFARVATDEALATA